MTPTYTIRSARYANQQYTAAVITTVESADVLISVEDTADLWAQMLASGVDIERYREPAGFNVPKDRHPEDMGKPIVIKAD